MSPAPAPSQYEHDAVASSGSCVVRLDFPRLAVADFGIAAGVASETYAPQVEEDWSSLLTYGVHRLPRSPARRSLDQSRPLPRRPARAGTRTPPRSNPSASAPRCRSRCPRRRTESYRQAGEGRSEGGVDRAAAVEWFAEASPNEHTTTASSGHSQSTEPVCPLQRDGQTNSPRKMGGNEVCGMTARSGWPKTLCRPPAMGSSARPISPCSTSRTGVDPGTCQARSHVERPRAVVKQCRIGRTRGERNHGVALAPPNRWCRTRDLAAAAPAPRNQGAGWSLRLEELPPPLRLVSIGGRHGDHRC